MEPFPILLTMESTLGDSPATLLCDSLGACGTDPVPSLAEGQKASLLMEKMLGHVRTVQIRVVGA